MAVWHSPKTGAKYAGGVSVDTFRSWLENGLRYSKVGRLILIKQENIDAFIEAHEAVDKDLAVVRRRLEAMDA